VWPVLRPDARTPQGFESDAGSKNRLRLAAAPRGSGAAGALLTGLLRSSRLTTSADKPTTEYVEEASTELGTPYLEVMRGMDGGAPVRLAPGTVVVGRDDSADITFAADGVSRKHARLTIESTGEVRVVDLASRNGTYLNGRRVEQASLRDGDELRLGSVGLRLRYVGGNTAGVAGSGAAIPELPLSARELEVAQLVAAGLTNAEIGAKLHISPATVGRHLSNVYERLGIHSRAALVARLGGR
jgi:DNA-binding CsgD family transcriptional regulator